MWILLILIAACRAQDQAFLTYNLFSTLISSCEEFYLGRDLQIGDDHYEVFTENLEDIAALNNNNENTYEAGVNCFTALSADEKLQWLGLSAPEGLESSGTVEESSGDPPDEYDRRDDNTTTAARSFLKGSSSCRPSWAFTSIAVLESAYLVLAGGDPLDVDFSEQQLLDCTYESDKTYDACKGGWMVTAWNTLKTDQNSTLVSEAALPYTGVDNKCNITGLKNAMSKVKVTRVNRHFSDYGNATPMASKTAGLVWNKYAIAVAIRAESSFYYYKTGIFNTQCVNTSVNNGLTFVAYTSTYFVAKGNWGTHWGENGHVKISRIAGNLCQVYSYIMYPLLECSYGVGADGKCKAGSDPTPQPTEQPEPEPKCTKKCKRGKECYRKPHKINKMGCKCPSDKYGSKCEYNVDCSKEDKIKMCKRKQNNWKQVYWKFKCLKNFGAKKCPHSCGRCG